MATNPDPEILRLLGRRDPRGFDLAYAEYGARLFSFLSRLVGHGQQPQAEDLLQQTFLRLAERGPELRRDSDLRAWLFTVARNAFLGQVRGQKQAAEAVNLELVADYSPDAEARLMLGDVERALSRLRLEDRELLLTSVIDAKPDVREPSAEPSLWPLIATLMVTVMFVCSIFSPWAVLFGAVPATIALIAWFWPKSPMPKPEPTIS